MLMRNTLKENCPQRTDCFDSVTSVVAPNNYVSDSGLGLSS